MSNQPQLVVAAIIVDRLAEPRRVLAARRRTPVEVAGRWELPGGKVEMAEDPVAALHRELGEELGIGVRVGTELGHPDEPAWPISDRYEMRVWLVEISEGDPRPVEDHDQIRWLTWRTLHQVDWLPADRSVVDHLRRLLGPAVRG